MEPIDQSALKVCPPRIATASQRLRQGIRFTIAILCLSAIFLFLFVPRFAPWVVYPIPVAAALFLLLTVFEAILRWFTRIRRRWRIRGKAAGSRTHGRFMVAKRLVGFALAVLLADSVLYHTHYGDPYGNLQIEGIQPIPIAIAVLLLLAVVNETSVFGFFVCAADTDRLTRLQRQTYFSILSASRGGAYRPLSSNEVELDDEGTPEEYQVVAFPATDVENQWTADGQNSWEDDFECDVAAVTRVSSPAKVTSTGPPRRLPR